MNVLRAEEFDIPIISIGNLSVGGTGKTPHTEYLIRLLQNKYRVAVLSRGYKRKSSGFILANDRVTADTIGDESYQLFRKFPGILVAVDANRKRGIKKLLSFSDEIRPEVILLDDAYQHRYVKPSLSILLTEYSRPFSRDELLPAGRLREPAKNEERADIVIVTKTPVSPDYGMFHEASQDLSEEFGLNPSQKLFFSGFSYGELQAVFPDASSIYEIDSAVLFSGIASPQPLIDYLKRYIPELTVQLFPDHHAYNQSDFDRLLGLFQTIEKSKKILITTEKDMVKLINQPLPEELRKRLYYLPVKIIFDPAQQDDFNKTIIDHVTTIKRNR
jgi:tetraacyldisaccharide 4''-kinase